MNHRIKRVKDVVVFELDGKVWGDWSSMELKDMIKTLLDHGDRKYVIDLEKVGLITSAGIGILVAAYTSVMNAHGAFKICGASERSKRAFSISGTWTLFDTHETCEEALMALGVGVPGLDP